MKMKKFKYGTFPTWTLEEVVGDPLPEIDPAYHEAVPEFFLPSNRPDVAAYFLASIFKGEEFAIARALPGTPADIAAKTGFDEETVGQVLEKLVGEGKITKTPELYVKLSPVSAMYWDYMIFAIDNNGVEIDEELEKTLKLCRSLALDLDMYPEGTEARQVPMRCIPKFESIKGIPGAMDCESIETLVMDAFRNGEFTIERCWCRVGLGRWIEGKYNEEVAGKTTPSGIYEGQKPIEGHCMVLGKTAKHWQQTINAPKPTEDDVKRVLGSIEAHNVILIGSPTRLGGNICVCDLSTCYPNGRYQAWKIVPSRFRPITDEEECARCRACESLCQLGAITCDETGFPIVDGELCIGCGNCVVFCPHKAKEMELFRPVEWIPDGDVHLFMPMPPQ